MTFFNKLNAREALELPSRSRKSDAVGEKETDTAQTGDGEQDTGSSLNLYPPTLRKSKAILASNPQCALDPPYLLRWLPRFGVENKNG